MGPDCKQMSQMLATSCTRLQPCRTVSRVIRAAGSGFGQADTPLAHPQLHRCIFRINGMSSAYKPGAQRTSRKKGKPPLATPCQSSPLSEKSFSRRAVLLRRESAPHSR